MRKLHYVLSINTLTEGFVTKYEVFLARNLSTYLYVSQKVDIITCNSLNCLHVKHYFDRILVKG